MAETDSNDVTLSRSRLPSPGCLGETMEPGAVAEAIGDDEQVLESLDRTVDHLRGNDVNLSATPLALGPQLALRGREEVFTGSGSDAANDMLFREGRGAFMIPTKAQL